MDARRWFGRLEDWRNGVDKPVALRGDNISIGRGANMDIRLSSLKVSKRHALLERSQWGWVLRDLGSENGTMVNGASPVPGADTWNLRDGDILELADMRLLFGGGQLWVPADAVDSPKRAGRTGAMPASLWVWVVGAALLLLLIWGMGGSATPGNPGGNAWATQAAVDATLTAAVPSVTPPPTDTPSPSKTTAIIRGSPPKAAPREAVFGSNDTIHINLGADVPPQEGGLT